MPFADNSVYKVPDELSDEQVLFLADILPTAYEVGVLNGMVAPGDVVAIVGAGPIGLAAILTAQLYTPGHDRRDRPRRQPARERAAQFGADTTINNGREDAVARVMELTDGLGADVALRGGRRAADLRARGRADPPRRTRREHRRARQPATLHLEKLWIRDVTITTGLVDTYTHPAADASWSRAVAWTRRCSPRTASRSATRWPPTTRSPTPPTAAR